MKLVNIGKKFAAPIGLLAVGITAIGGAICSMRRHDDTDEADDFEPDEASDDYEDEAEETSEESAVDDAE